METMRKRSVVVVVFDGLEWIIAWRQLGVQTIQLIFADDLNSMFSRKHSVPTYNMLKKSKSRRVKAGR